MSFFRRRKAEPQPESHLEAAPLAEPESVEPQPVEEWAVGVTLLDDGTVRMKWDSVDEAKLAIKQLRLKKRELNIQKRSVNAEMKELRLERREQVAQQGSKMRGGGKFGQFVRASQTAGRDHDRRQHVARLAPYEQAKADIDRQITNVDMIIARIEQTLLEQQD